MHPLRSDGRFRCDVRRARRVREHHRATTSSTLSRNPGYSRLGPVEIASHMGNQGHRFTDDGADRGSAAISLFEVVGVGREHE